MQNALAVPLGARRHILDMTVYFPISFHTRFAFSGTVEQREDTKSV